MNEKALHADLKRWYGQPNDRFEVPIDGFIVDIVRGRLLVEIQTANFAAVKRKLTRLAIHHPVRLVYPIAREKWITKLSNDGQTPASRRKSPKRGSIEHVFEELVSFPNLLSNPNFSLEALFIQEEVIRRYVGGRRAWRSRGWVTHERRLIQVLSSRLFKSQGDMGALLPATLTEPFTTSDLAKAIRKPRPLAQKMAYCLREMGAITPVGKRRQAILYTRALA